MAHDPTVPVDARGVSDASARVGSRLAGKWHLDALLGVGGTAAVYAATHRNGLRGAVKVLRAAYSAEPEMRRRFLREGYIANKVEHSGAVRVLDDDVAEDGCAYIVMELLEGEALDERAARSGGRLGVQETMWLAWQLLDVLAAAHGAGIIHRDVKPENVFLTKDGVVKVLDFGLACLFEEAEVGESVTRTGSVMGTPAFMAPEQARGRWALVDAQSDVWSVGATMFTLLTGDFVHGDQETAAEMIAATFNKRAPSLAVRMPSAPMPLVQIVDCALEREKGKRFLDARSMQAALAAAHHLIYGGPLPVDRTHPSAPPRPSGRPSNDAIFSFTSSAPRPSLAPLGEQTTVSLQPPVPVTRSAPPTTRRRRRPAHPLVPLTAGVIAGLAGALTVGFVILGVRSPGTAEPAAPSLEVARLPPFVDPPLPPPPPVAVVETPAASAEPPVADTADAGTAPTVPRWQTWKPASKAGPHYGLPPVTEFPGAAPARKKH